ncbi:MAG: UbiA family prenyltransferase [Opitutales bacterium]
MRSKFRAFLELLRLPNAPTVWSNVLAAWLLGGGVVADWTLLQLCTGATLLYFGGTILNDAFDAEWDRRHRPERAIPSGRLGARTVWVLGYTSLTIGAVVLLFGRANPFFLGVLLTTIVAYDAGHKQYAVTGILLMGSARAFLYLSVSSAAVGPAQTVPLQAVVWALNLGCYIAALSLLARGEAKSEPRPWYTRPLLLGSAAATGISLVLVSLPITPGFGYFPGMHMCVIFVGWTGYCVWLTRKNSRTSVGAIVSRLLAGIILFDAIPIFLLLDRPEERFWTFAVPTLFLLAFLLQRKFAAT